MGHHVILFLEIYKTEIFIVLGMCLGCYLYDFYSKNFI